MDEPTVLEARADDGRLVSTTTLGPDGRPDGEFVAYAPDGTVAMRMLYRAGVPDGPATVFRNGVPQTEMTYAAGLLDGAMRGYDPAGRLLSVVRYAAGKRHGRMECFTAEGKPLMSAEYKDDRLDGDLVEYRPDGSVRRRVPHKDDLPDGEALEFHPGGAPAERTLYRAGAVVEGPERLDDPDAPASRKGLVARLRGK
ncbi:toxin-antitoxin system YwqK family antitoxin [Azospirillum sp. ST 5-10]|uniref:toxin-antitoxin system YwqK family antitoxin n=1 Tax=unclassified Azospirillum TaxID=2630922 RepID=UPI003F49BD88